MNFYNNQIFATTLSAVQRTLIILGAIIIMGTLIYFLVKWFLKSLLTSKNTKMITMNLVIKYQPFMEYLKYQEDKKEAYYLYLIKINNLSQLESKFNESTIRAYLTKVAKELSVYLPYSGKIAQTNARDTFIMYYPKSNENEYEVGEQFKLLASKSYGGGLNTVTKTASVAIIEDDDYTDLNLANTLISSVRNLGLVTKYDNTITNGLEDYNAITSRIAEFETQYKSVKVIKNQDEKYKENYTEVFLGGLKIQEYLEKIPVIDQPWVNMEIIENLIVSLNENNIFINFNIPILLNILEKDGFVESLEHLILGNGYRLDQVILSIKVTNITFEEKVMKNLLLLSNLGVKLSLELFNLNQENYSYIQKFKVDRLEVDDKLMNDPGISELIYFGKVNNLEVIYKTNLKDQNLNALNISHITSDDIELKQSNIKGKRRGRR